MSDLHFLYSTIGSRDEALELGRTLVRENLVACVNVGQEITSIYPWEGELQEDGEVPLTMKTTSSQLSEAMNRLEEIHPYDCPEVLATTIDRASDAYAEWVHEYCD